MRFSILFTLCLAALSFAASPKVVGYYPYWVQYSQFFPGDVRYEFVTHIHYVGATPVDDGSLVLADETDAANFELLAKNAQDNKVALLLVVGGADAEATLKTIAQDENLLSAFTSAVQEWVGKYQLAGIELDWQNLTEEDKSAYEAMVQALVSAKGEKLLSLTTYPLASSNAYDASVLSKADYITVSVVEQMTEEVAVLKPNLSGKDIENALNTLSSAGVDKSKMVPVVSLLAKTFLGAKGLGTPHQGAGSGNEGYLTYRELMDNAFKGTDYQVTFDEATESEVAVSSTESIVFMGIPSVKAVANRVKSGGMSGVAIYDLSQDHQEPIVSLLVTVGQILRPEVNYTKKKK
ncbi:MAG: glycoside hydrolase family 18 protein [Fibrobacter sp.]|jgi:GH18 family chitinase|nr:glycoside hydrolase family 18 protein [Fibrobacter sp.]